MRLEQLLQTNKRLAKADQTSPDQNNNNDSDSDNDEKTEQHKDGHGRNSTMVVSSSGSSSDNESEPQGRHGNKKVNKDAIIGKGNGKSNSSFRGSNSGKAVNDDGPKRQKQQENGVEPPPSRGLEREQDHLTASPARVSFPSTVNESRGNSVDPFATLFQNSNNAGSLSIQHQAQQSGTGVGVSLNSQFLGALGAEFGHSAVATTDLTDPESFFTAIGVTVPEEAQRPPKPNQTTTKIVTSSSSSAAAGGTPAGAVAVAGATATTAVRRLPEPTQTATAQALGLSTQSSARSSDDDYHSNAHSNEEPNQSSHLTASSRQTSSNRLPGQPSTDNHSNQKKAGLNNEEDMRRLVGGGLDDSTLPARILAKSKRAQVSGGI